MPYLNGLIKLSRRCLRARTGTNEWFKQHSPDAAEDETHEYFISVLRETLQSLVSVHELQQLESQDFSLRPKVTGKARTDTGEDLATLEITNAFRHLEIEDIDDEVLESVPDAPKLGKSQADSKGEYEIDGDLDGFFFAMNSLWETMLNARKYIKELWATYLERKWVLTTVSVVTNTAIELVKKAEENLGHVPQPPEYAAKGELGGRDNLGFLRFMQVCVRDGIPHPEELMVAQ